MKWVFIILISIAALVALIYLAGSLMEVSHTATVERLIPLEKDRVWSIVTNFKEYPSWRSDVKSVTAKDESHWTEVNAYDDQVDYQLTVLDSTGTVETRIMNKDLPYGGYWTIQLEQAEGGTLVTITEHGEVFNPLFRFMSKYIFGHDTTIKQYLDNLSKG